ncbi:MAG TPA: Spy/CpxP family protein refolding chaperone [Devosiaceae bacterium]|nr:Spy/CpxP family protein refolding chaperone [Devosiaceae bacterium]
MKFLTTAAAAVLLVGAMSGSSFAQSAGAAPLMPVDAGVVHVQFGQWQHQGGWGHFGRHAMGANRGTMACGNRAAEALEIAFIHIKYAVNPNASQAALLDALKTAALTDQKTFADACKTLIHPGGDNTAKPTMLDRLERQQSLVNARAAALNDVVPRFKAFYDSLSDQQKATLDQAVQRGPAFGLFGGQGARGHMSGLQHMGHLGGQDADQPAPSAGENQQGQ